MEDYYMKKERSSNWGGFRENSGRKPKAEGTRATTLSFSCTLEQKDAIKKLVKESGLSQSEWILCKLL